MNARALRFVAPKREERRRERKERERQREGGRERERYEDVKMCSCEEEGFAEVKICR